MANAIRFCHYLLILLVASVGLATAQENYRPMPWHLVDNWWDLNREVPDFQSLRLDVTIEGEVSDSVCLYVAPIGIAHLSGTPFYGGIQTNADGYTRENPRLRKIGRGLLMSMWNQRSPEAIRPADGGFFQSSGHEGDFVSVRRPYSWTPGRYTYCVLRMDSQRIDEKDYTWVGAFLYSHDRNENIFIGALRFPGEKLQLDRGIANFVEIYGPRRPVEDIPQVTITFAPPVVNGEPAKGFKAKAIYPAGVPDYAQVEALEDGALRVEVGRPVEREKREVRLYPPERP